MTEFFVLTACPREPVRLVLCVLSKDARQIKGIVLVNPATSYDRSHWRVIGSLVASAPGQETFGVAATLTLATTVPDTAMVGAFRTAVTGVVAAKCWSGGTNDI